MGKVSRPLLSDDDLIPNEAVTISASPPRSPIRSEAASQKVKPKKIPLDLVQVRWPEEAIKALKFLCYDTDETRSEVLLKAFKQYAASLPQAKDHANNPIKQLLNG